MAKLVHNVQKKQHRERSQTAERSRLGFLEKKKDYRLRADDYHKKQAAIKALKKKAQAYNPDEYYHAMTRKKTDERGILIAERGNQSLSVQQAKLLKSQDANYVRTMRLNEKLRIAKEKEGLDFGAEGKHTVFVDSVKDQEDFSPEAFFATSSGMLERRENRVRLSQLESNDKMVRQEVSTDLAEKDRRDKEKLAKYKLLRLRLDREKQLREVEQEMENVKELMKKGSKKKMVDSEGNVTFKWKNHRKK